MNAEFNGRWVRRAGILVPVIDPAPELETCSVCGSVSVTRVCRPCADSSRQRVHGNHAGYAQHQRRNELPCRSCSDAEKVYQGSRYRRGQLSDVDRRWCERQAVKWSWIMDAKHNRTC